jgi:DNA polymerase-3 subunit delta'
MVLFYDESGCSVMYPGIDYVLHVASNMKKEEVVISDEIKAQVDEMLTSAHIPHAIHFSGPEGSGKFAMALYLAKAILCTNLENQACHQCPSCLKAEKLIHPDLHFSFPVIGADKSSNDFVQSFREMMKTNPYADFSDWMKLSGGENKQANINKKECNEIIQKIGLKSFEGKSKVLIIWYAEYLGNEGNRLLKLFEEPPANTYFILISEQKDKLLNTILSRFQLISVPPVPKTKMKQVLLHDYGYSDHKAEQISFLSYGNFNKALKLIEGGDEVQYEEDFLEWLRASYKLDPLLIDNWISKFSKYNKEQQKFFLDYCLEFIRTLHLMSYLDREHIRFTDHEYETAKKLMKIVLPESVADVTEIIEESSRALERNANVKILFTERSIQLHEIMLNVRKQRVQEH